MSEIEIILNQKGILFWVTGGEAVTKCIFSDCDSRSREKEGHLYFSLKTGQYDCKKCGAKGNIVTLLKHFEDKFFDYSHKGDFFSGFSRPEKETKKISLKLIEECQKALPSRIVDYLNTRGISEKTILKYKLGYKYEYGKSWISIPIKDINGNYSFFKLREDPEFGKGKITWPNGIEAQIYDWESLLTASGKVLICEGEMDALLMKSEGIQAISGTHGAGTVKDQWLEYFKPELEYFICYDNDNAGKEGAEKFVRKLLRNGCKNLHIINLPEEVGEGGDLGDYVVRLGLPIDDLFTKYAKSFPEKIDTSSFQQIKTEDIIEVLEPTIKKDDVNKIITTLAMVNTYTDESQFNVFFSAPSSTGKSHIPLSVSELFPTEDLIILSNCSPTAFFHEQGKYIKETNEIRVDLSRKIIIFTDMPHPELLTRLRSFLSHDQKESKSKITDKSEKGGNRTKTVILIGYPTVIFCSAGLKVDEQESTRFMMLSPSIEQDKLIAGIKQSILKEVDGQSFKKNIESDEKRQFFKKRIMAIKQEHIADVKIENPALIEKLFLTDITKAIRPRQQRDIKKVICLIKGFALLNLWFRKREGDYIYATEDDINEAFKLWNFISLGQEYGLAPYIYAIYTDLIIPLWKKQLEGKGSEESFPNDGIERKDILKKHSEFYGRPLNMVYLRQHILPQLEQAGLIAQEKSNSDGRHMVVFPLEIEEEEIINNSDVGGGVKTIEEVF